MQKILALAFVLSVNCNAITIPVSGTGINWIDNALGSDNSGSLGITGTDGINTLSVEINDEIGLIGLGGRSGWTPAGFSIVSVIFDGTSYGVVGYSADWGLGSGGYIMLTDFATQAVALDISLISSVSFGPAVLKGYDGLTPVYSQSITVTSPALPAVIPAVSLTPSPTPEPRNAIPVLMGGMALAWQRFRAGRPLGKSGHR